MITATQDVANMVNGPPRGRATVPLKCRRRRASSNCAKFGSVSSNAPATAEGRSRRNSDRKRCVNSAPVLTPRSLEDRMAYPAIPCPTGLAQLPTPDVSGVYFLWRQARVVYVGQSRHVKARVLEHLADTSKKFDQFSYVRCGLLKLGEWERFYIESLTPEHNKCGRSKVVRAMKKAGISFPTAEFADARPDDGRSLAETFGLTKEQMRWLERQPEAPKRVRIAHLGVRRVCRTALRRWIEANPEKLEAARAYVAA